SATSQIAAQAESQSPAVHSDAIVHDQRATRLPSVTTVVQASASKTNLPSAPNPFISPSDPSDGAAEKSSDVGDSSAGRKIPVRAVNCKRIVLDYEIKDIGPSGVSMVDLWYTHDGRRWEKCPTGAQRT